MQKQHSIEILFENPEFLIINKPSGLVVHSDGKTDEPTLVDFILKERPEMAEVGEPAQVDGKIIYRPGIVHRLDRETSGVLVLAKNQRTFEFLKKQFQEKTIQKTYHAFVWGHLRDLSGIIDEPIGRNKNDFRQRHAGRGIRGEAKEAVTKWQAVNQFEDETGQQFSFMHLSPQTGRTHQLRVHMKFLQRPIVSDKLYAPTKPDALGFRRVALHARRISFTDDKGTEVVVEAPYPKDFQEALARYVKI